ncbi:MAG: DUF3786 domain-containing protein [Deltaproteobacteria bacterium]|nr:DUF3786 domain-containing protein [Deltaproteobacteria bacterium]
MEGGETVFERNYKNYLAQLKKISFESIAPALGGEIKEEAIKIPLLGRNYEVSSNGITDPLDKRPPYDICVILCKYLLLCPDTPPKEDEWVSFRNFKDSGPLTNYFNNDVESSISSYFKGKLDGLKKASKSLAGYRPNLEVNYDLAVQFDTLPRIPVIMLFNDADDEFLAKCSVLFELRAEKYLDAECIAMLGRQLFYHLRNAEKRK